MIDERDLLERAARQFRPEPGAVERVLRRRDRKRRNQRIGAVAVAAAVAVAGVGVGVRAFQHTSVTTPAGTSSWTRIVPSEQSGLDGADLRAVTVAGSGYIAVGDISVGGGPSPVWTSPDGVSWANVPVTDAPDAMNLWGVAAGPQGVVAVGNSPDGSPDSPGVWFSPDGSSWSLADLPPPPGANVVDMSGVVFVSDQFIALGIVQGTDGNDGYVWRSSDGVSWQAVADEQVFGGEGDQRISDVAAGPSGFVAVGGERAIDGARDGAAVTWSSPDGNTWTRTTPVGAGNDATGWTWMNAVVATGSGFVAVGDAGPALFDTSGAVWTSPDGAEWTRHPDPEAFTRAEVLNVAPTNDGYLAVGDTYPASGKHPEGRVWTSPDGLDWTSVPDPNGEFVSMTGGRVFVEGLVAGRDGTVAVGLDQGADASYQDKKTDGAVWFLPPG